MKSPSSIPILLAVIAVTLPSVLAAKISDSLKEADCNFQIHYNNRQLNVPRQMITLRAVSGVTEADTDKEIGRSGYRAYHLEFRYEGKQIANNTPLRVDFYDANNQRLHSIQITTEERKNEVLEKISHLYRRHSRYFAICLENVPLLLLDDIKKIEIEDISGK